MNFKESLNQLNVEQKKAVSSPSQYVLILAGAGSGKTKVLTHRMAYAVQEGWAKPFEILAVTFTNKAAREMRERAVKLNPLLDSAWVGTFHGICHRLLKFHPLEARLPKNFQIIDGDDQLKIIKKILKEMQVLDKTVDPRAILSFISGHKEAGRLPGDLNQKLTHTLEKKVFEEYQARCEKSGVVDFADLQMKAVNLFKNNPSILLQYQNRFRHILVDEFQDTNHMQFEWIKLMKNEQSKILVVGDDDQSIYGWRGAVVANVRRFVDDFSPCEVLKLEQNYRSTSTILSAANHVIQKNAHRMGKNLWSVRQQGMPILLHESSDEINEALVITKTIQQWIEKGKSPAEVAILYRSNAQSRVLEEKLMAFNIPYKIYGGLRFFERAEIKDVLAYLKLALNPSDDLSFERVINIPARGLGDKGLFPLYKRAQESKKSLWFCLKEWIETKPKDKITEKLLDFQEKVLQVRRHLETLGLGDLVRATLEDTGILKWYEDQASKDPEKQAKVDNLKELVSTAHRFEPLWKQQDIQETALEAFLAQSQLEGGERGEGENGPCVQLMTLHASKGLEFPFVILAGWDDGLFPSARATQDDEGLQEERRLAYVGITRAMDVLMITYTESRSVYGIRQKSVPCRFLNDIDALLFKKTKTRRWVESRD